MLTALSFIILSLFAIWFFVELWTSSLGDCDIILQTDILREKQALISVEEAVFSFELSLYNQGRQQGLFIDCQARVLPDGIPKSGIGICVQAANANYPRDDGYWESCIIKAGKNLPLNLKVKVLSSLSAEEAVKIVKDLWVEVLYKFYGRTPLRYKRYAFKIKFEDFPRVKALEVKPAVPVKEKAAREGVIPINTRLLRPGDDVVEVIKTYASASAQPGDLIAIAESPLAIMQNRLKYVEDIEPSWLATKLNRYFHYDSSLSSVYGMEMAIREAGKFRILAAFFMGALARLWGQRGGFYRWAGRAVATIDDCTGTLPPFDKYVVLGPHQLDRVVKEIKAQTSLEAAVVDVNDLRRVDILASTCPLMSQAIKKALELNPQGNAGEQTPLVLIKKEVLN
jgi:hypothetical protein